MNKNKLWSFTRSLTFIIVGVLNTVLIRQEALGTWKNYLGYILLIVGIIDLFFFVKLYFKNNKDISE
jgi:hypothetical protein